MWLYKDKTTDNMKSGHFVEIKVNQASPLLLAGCLCVLVVIFQSVLSEDFMKRMGYTMAMDDLDVDEDLPNFFKTLPVREARLIISEHEHI